jgi:hypothetical protein
MKITEAIKEAIWLKTFISELYFIVGPIVVFYDNQSAIHLINDHMHHERIKYIDICYYLVRDVVLECKILMKKIGTEKNPTDMLIAHKASFNCKVQVLYKFDVILLLTLCLHFYCYFGASFMLAFASYSYV